MPKRLDYNPALDDERSESRLRRRVTKIPTLQKTSTMSGMMVVNTSLDQTL